MENKKNKQKSITPLKKNCKKDHESIIEIFVNMRKLKKEIMFTPKIKICQMRIEKGKRIYEKLLL